MSRTTLYVRFEDGTFRYGIFDRDTNTAWTMLFSTAEEAWEAWGDWVHAHRTPNGTPWAYEPGFGLAVEVAVEDLPAWPATATLTHLTSNHAPFDLPGWGHGLPPPWAKR